MEELIERSLKGDQSAYIELIKTLKTDMYKIAVSQLHDIDDVNDALQETIMVSYAKLPTLKTPSYFKTWIMKILINECNNIHRKKKLELGLFNTLSTSIDVVSYAEREIQTKEDEIDFDLLVNRLNYDERLILTLYYKNNYTPTEISRILNISVNTVKSKILRAKQKLQEIYNEGGLKNGRKR